MLTVPLAALLLAGAVSSATANQLSINSDTFRFTFASLSWETSVTRTTCPVTLAGSFHRRSFTKETELIGHITSASIADASCTGGRLTILGGTLPWSLGYNGFFEELPYIEGINLLIVGLAFQRTSSGITCLFRTEASEPGGGIANLDGSGNVTAFSADTDFEIDLDTPGFFCDISGDSTLSGSASATTGAGGTLNIDLIEVDPPPADLRASPSAVAIEQGEASDTFTLSNEGGSTATIDSVEDEAAAQFDVSGCGAERTIAASGSCVYTIQVDERPLASGRVTVTYDDGQAGTRRVSVEVDIAGVDREAILAAEPSSVTIEALEQNDIVEIRNARHGLTATVDRVTTTTSDFERPDFTVITTGCSALLALNESCHYLISVNSRPEANGRITVEYDDGAGGNRTLVIDVDIAGPDPAELEADPTDVVVERLESNDSFVVRNISPDTAAVVNRAILTSDDTERPEFSVTGIGCPEIFLAGTSCTYVVSVNSRPEADGRYAIEYDDGAGSDRTVTVTVDIAS